MNNTVTPEDLESARTFVLNDYLALDARDRDTTLTNEERALHAALRLVMRDTLMMCDSFIEAARITARA